MSDAIKGIFRRRHTVVVNTDMIPDPTASEFVGSHFVEVTVCARWQRTPTAARLLDWTMEEVALNGVALTEANIPADFPMQNIINACTATRAIRVALEATGPGEDE